MYKESGSCSSSARRSETPTHFRCTLAVSSTRLLGGPLCTESLARLLQSPAGRRGDAAAGKTFITVPVWHGSRPPSSPSSPTTCRMRPRRPRPRTMFHPTRKETTMQYKTICLQMIQDRPEMYDRLLKQSDAAADAGTLRPAAEEQPPGLEGAPASGQAGRQRQPDRERGAGAGPAGNWVCLPRRLRQRTTSRSPWTTRWRSSAVIRRPRKGVARPRAAVALRPRP